MALKEYFIMFVYLEITTLKDNIEGSGSVENDKHNKNN